MEIDQINDDPQPYVAIDGNFQAGLLLLADHARNVLPARYDALGLAPEELKRHIAYDIGVEAVTRQIADQLAVPAVMCGFSRLLIDPNRGEDDPTLIRQLYDGSVIPGNYPLEPEERKRRLINWYRPYHEAVARAVDRVATESAMPPLIMSIHSFTPRMQGYSRPWHVSLLWDTDDRAMRLLYNALASEGSLIIGDNEPYDGALTGDTMYRHGTLNGYPHVLIEIRQDLIAKDAGQTEWAERLAKAIADINAHPEVHQQLFFESRAQTL